jgi:hypothetical protein
VTVTFTTPLPTASYAAELTITSTAAFAANANCSGNNNDCYFFNVTAKTASGFTIQFRRGLDGALANVSPNSVTVDYFAILNK